MEKVRCHGDISGAKFSLLVEGKRNINAEFFKKSIFNRQRADKPDKSDLDANCANLHKVSENYTGGIGCSRVTGEAIEFKMPLMKHGVISFFCVLVGYGRLICVFIVALGLAGVLSLTHSCVKAHRGII